MKCFHHICGKQYEVRWLRYRMKRHFHPSIEIPLTRLLIFIWHFLLDSHCVVVVSCDFHKNVHQVGMKTWFCRCIKAYKEFAHNRNQAENWLSIAVLKVLFVLKLLFFKKILPKWMWWFNWFRRHWNLIQMNGSADRKQT